LGQIEAVRHRYPSLQLDPVTLAEGSAHLDGALAWARKQLGATPILIYASAPPESVSKARAALGQQRAAELVEDAFRRIATELAAAGVRRFVVAGGETSGAVVEALGVRALAIGPEIAPGVPWTAAVGGEPFLLALKSGNFGGPDFFTRAFEVLG
ncbi:MAG: nucleotide-binding domain containing protein, partial [Burkholderiales bacterium]